MILTYKLSDAQNPDIRISLSIGKLKGVQVQKAQINEVNISAEIVISD